MIFVEKVALGKSLRLGCAYILVQPSQTKKLERLDLNVVGWTGRL